MSNSFSRFCYEYIPKGNIPLLVWPVAKGQHHERDFHTHDFSELTLITDGRSVHIAGTERAPVSKGDLLLIHPGITHGFEHVDNLELVNILFIKEKLALPVLDAEAMPFVHKVLMPDGQSLQEKDAATPVMTLEPVVFEEIRQDIMKIKEEENAPGGAQLGMLTLFITLLLKLSRIYQPELIPRYTKEYSIGEGIGFMRKHYHRKLSLKEIAKAAFMSERNFYRQFKLASGMTPMEFLTGIRLEKATELLLQGNLSITEISLRCGFYDASHFCKVFQEHHSISPKKYLNHMQKIEETYP